MSSGLNAAEITNRIGISENDTVASATAVNDLDDAVLAVLPRQFGQWKAMSVVTVAARSSSARHPAATRPTPARRDWVVLLASCRSLSGAR